MAIIMYAYVKNNPLKYTDPFGLRARSSCYSTCSSTVYFYGLYKPKVEPSLLNYVVDPVPVNSLLRNTHMALDVVGLSPGVGIIPDVINAIAYTIEGDFANAGISGLSAIPLLGQVVTAGKYGAKVASINKFANNPDIDSYTRIKGKSNTFKSSNDNSIWSKDTTKHDGEQWKRWKSQKESEKGKPPKVFRQMEGLENNEIPSK